MIFDYEVFKLIWWVLVGVLLIGFALTNGFDMGVSALIPVIGKNDTERRVLINTVGAHWDGNQVWFITAGGAIFAAWPLVYATAFSGLYLAMLLVLLALFLRPVGFDYRSKIDDPRWRNAWDWGLFIGGAVPPLLFGVAFGNMLLGVPFHFDDLQRPIYSGGFFALLNPFALLAGLLSLTMIVMHGACWLQMRTDDFIQGRAQKVARLMALLVFVLFAFCGVLVAYWVEGFRIEAIPDVNGIVVPADKTVSRGIGFWLDNYRAMPWMLSAPLLGLVGALLTYLLSRTGRSALAFTSSCLTLSGIIMTAGFSMFPFVMPSTGVVDHSLTLWDSCSSHLTLAIMFWVAMFFVPIVLAYSFWAYRAMWGKVTTLFIKKNEHSLY